MAEGGGQGAFARGPGEWVRAIAGLAADPSARERMGRAGRRRVAERYSVEALAPRFLARLREGRAAPAARSTQRSSLEKTP